MATKASRPRGSNRSPHFDSLQQQAYLSLWRTYDRLRMLEDELFAGFDLSSQQYNALRLLRDVYPEALPTLKLARRLVSRSPDITRMLDKLQRRRLVERQRTAANRRQVQIRISSSGLALLDEISEPLQQCHEAQLGHLSKSKLRQLLELLRDARRPHEPDDSFWR